MVARLRRKKESQPAAADEGAAEGLVRPAGYSGSGVLHRFGSPVRGRHAEGASDRRRGDRPRVLEAAALGGGVRQGAARSVDGKDREASDRASAQRDYPGTGGQAATPATASRV